MIIVASESIDQPADRLLVVKVVEVGDLLTLIAQETRTAIGPADPADHRAGVDHQVMLAAIEPVHYQQLELAPQALSFDVAGDDAEVGTGHQRWMVQQPGQRRAGHHRFDAGQRPRIGAFLDHGEQEVGDVANQAATGEQIDHAQPAVQPPRCQRRAARRTGDAHEATNLDLPLVEQLEELHQTRAVIGVGLVTRFRGVAVEGAETKLLGHRAIGGEQLGEQIALQRIVLALPFGQAQQLTDQTAARMRDQMQLRTDRQLLNERERVLDRAFGQRPMLQGIHVFAVAGANRLAGGRGGPPIVVRGRGPEVTEAALDAGHRAVQEDQQRFVFRQLRRAVDDRCQGQVRGQGTAVEARGVTLELALLEGLAKGGGRLLLEIDAKDFQQFDTQAQDAPFGTP